MLKGVRKSRSANQYPRIHRIHAQKSHFLPNTHTLAVTIPTGATSVAMDQWTFSPHALSQSKRRKPLNGLALSPRSHYNAASNVHYFRWLFAAAPPKSGGLALGSRQERWCRRRWRRRGVRWAAQKRWVGIYMCSRARGKSDQMSQSKCFALMTSPEEKLWRGSLDD